MSIDINWMQFFGQAIALVGWVLVVGAVYSVVEKALGGPAPRSVE